MIYMRGVVVCELGRTRDMVELDYSDFNIREDRWWKVETLNYTCYDIIGCILARVPIN